MDMDVTAPIVAVTVHPDRARVTRRGTVTLAAGPVELVVSGLPESLLDESVRVAGRSAAAVRVVGVDVVRRDLADAPDERVRRAEQTLRDAERALAEIDGADAGDLAREQLLHRLAVRSGDRLARALAEGTAGTERITEVSSAVAAQLVDVAASRREHAERRADAERIRAAAQAELDRLHGSGRRRRDARVAVEAEAPGELEIELTYVVGGAHWTCAYDARIDGAGPLALTWYGMVTQSTGEDWPACALTLSTARPGRAGAVPELSPWWVDVRPPVAPTVALAMSAPAGGAPRERFAAGEAVQDLVAQVEAGTLAVAWRLPRPTAVPADGTPHRATVTTATLDARLDHVVAPALDPSAHLRATVVNTSGHALLAGPLSAFLDDAFVGTTHIGATAPGSELELALGVDDRVAVERELMERTPGRALLGGKVSAVERWRIEVRNGRPTQARIVVRERVPVSRHPDVQVVDVELKPEPGGHDELGRLEWTATVEPGGTWEASIRFGVRHPRDAPITGWH
ncbi:MAG TPA: mucoidy inhibitor MuiA family protein [Pseudonocardia sp.]